MKNDSNNRTGPITIVGNANVIGDNSSASVTGDNVSARAEIYSTTHNTGPQLEDALVALDEFIYRLAFYQKSLQDAQRIREEALTARTEMTGSAPKWDKVRSILKGVAASVTGVAALTDLMNNVLSMVPHL